MKIKSENPVKQDYSNHYYRTLPVRSRLTDWIYGLCLLLAIDVIFIIALLIRAGG